MPLHVRDGQAWSPEVAPDAAWVRLNGQWRPLRGLATRSGGTWTNVLGTAVPVTPVQPQGAAELVGADVVLTLTNRMPAWRVRGTRRLFDAGIPVETTSLDDLASVFAQPTQGIVGTGRVVFEVYYHEPDGALDGSPRTFEVFF